MPSCLPSTGIKIYYLYSTGSLIRNRYFGFSLDFSLMQYRPSDKKRRCWFKISYWCSIGPLIRNRYVGFSPDFLFIQDRPSDKKPTCWFKISCLYDTGPLISNKDVGFRRDLLFMQFFSGRLMRSQRVGLRFLTYKVPAI